MHEFEKCFAAFSSSLPLPSFFFVFETFQPDICEHTRLTFPLFSYFHSRSFTRTLYIVKLQIVIFSSQTRNRILYSFTRLLQWTACLPSFPLSRALSWRIAVPAAVSKTSVRTVHARTAFKQKEASNNS